MNWLKNRFLSFVVPCSVLGLLGANPVLAQMGCDAHYTFDGNLSDSSGNGYNGTMFEEGGGPGKANFSDGVFGQALHLDGTSAMRAYLDLSPELCPQVTITGWIRIRADRARGTQYLLSTGAGAGPALRAAGRSAILDATGNGLSYQDALRDERAWFFFAGVYDYDASTYWFHWRDRTVEGTIAASRRRPEDAFWVGAYNDQLDYAIKDADIDDLRVVGKALGSDELVRIRGARPAALVMLDGSGEVAVAESATASGMPQPISAIGERLPMTSRDVDPDLLPERPPDLLSGGLTATDSETPLLEVPEGLGTASDGTPDPELTAPDDIPGGGFDYESLPAPTAGSGRADQGSTLDSIRDGLRQLDYRIVQVNSQVAESHMLYGMDLPLAVRISVENAADDDRVVFYAGIGEPGSNDAMILTEKYEAQGPGPHIVTLSVPLESPLVSDDNFNADLFLLGEKQMPGLPGQTVTIKSPIEDTDPDNNRKTLDYRVHRPKGYVLSHEHPTYGMAFGGNYAFAGTSGNYQYGIMQQGYTAECGGCKVLGQCDHGEVKGSFVAAIGSLGRDMGDHSHQMGPFHNSNSHLRYSTEWIHEAYLPSETDLQDSRMRIMVAFAVENEAMCEQIYYVNKGNGGPGGDGYACSHGDSFTSLKRQLDNLKAWASANSDWMEVAYTASDARRIVNADKLAIVLGVEAEYAFGAEDRTFDPVDRLNDYFNEGVRTFYLAHKINSRLAGADIYFPGSSQAGKAIRATQAISGCFYYDDNVAHFPLEGRLGNKLCDNNCGANAFKGGKITDACAYRLGEISELNMADYVLTRGGGQFNGFALYPWTPGFDGNGGSRVINGVERNNLGLSHDGERVVREAMLKGMIVNIDHVSSRARDQIHALAAEAFDNYPLNALHNKPNHMLTNGKGFWRHEYDLEDNELDYIENSGGFFGFRMGPTDSIEFPESGVDADCPRTSTESAKMLAWLVKRGLPVGYALDYATTTQGVYSRTFEGCGLNLGDDEIHEYDGHVAEGISHVGMMKKWHKELEAIGLEQEYVDALRDDGVEAFLRMWEKSEAVSGTGSQIARIVFGGANPHVH